MRYWLMLLMLCAFGASSSDRSLLPESEPLMASAPQEQDYRIQAQFKGRPVDIYLFARWTGYTHPVRPVDPLTPDQALARSGFSRAYLETVGQSHRFLFFETVNLEKTEGGIEASGPVGRRYAVRRIGERWVVANELGSSAAVVAERFAEVMPDGRVALVTAKVAYSYEYIYDEAGMLRKALITNPIGTNVLDF